MKNTEEGAVHSLDSFEVGELVWAKNSYRSPAVFWPSVVVDPAKHAPEPFRKHSYHDRLLVMYYGPSTTLARPRDFYWVKEGDILPWKDYLQQLQQQRLPKKDLEQAFRTALDEALSAEARYREAVPDDEVEEQEATNTITCVACGATLTAAEEESYQANDGRCLNCHESYKEKHTCMMCRRPVERTDAVFVSCYQCQACIHAACEMDAAACLQDGTQDNYLCPLCRPPPAASRGALVEYEERLREMRPCPPRTPFLLFSYEMIRLYREGSYEYNLPDVWPLMRAGWLNLSDADRAEYYRAAEEEGQIFEIQKRQYEGLFNEYQAAARQLGAAMDPDVLPEGHRLALPAPGRGIKRERDSYMGDEAPSEKKVKQVYPKREMEGMPEEVTVVCQGIRGSFLLASQKIVCLCKDCAKRPPEQREFTPTQFENHCGAGSAKKWKASLRVEPGSVPEVPYEATPMQIGRWLDMRGIEIGKPRPPGDMYEPSRGRVTTSVGPPRLPAGPPRKGGEAKLERKAEPAKPWFDAVHGNFRPIKVRWAGDRCSVCDSDIDYDHDQLVSCDLCGITAHQSCYGVPEAPGPDDMWLCRACELKENGKPPPQCCLCPVAGGALKTTTLSSPQGAVWCHAACMQWIPEVTCIDPTRMEPIDRIQYIQKERWELQCSLCRQRMGAKIQCSNCYSAFHPLCARMAGLHMEMVDSAGGGPLQLVAYCSRHCTPAPELAGVQLVREGGEVGALDGSENGLWNAQPFPQNPALEIPECPAGCARAQAFNAERVFHGTGSGWTSKAGFWIPERPPDLPQLAGPAATGGLPPRPPKHPLSTLGKGQRDKKMLVLAPAKRKPGRPFKPSAVPAAPKTSRSLHDEGPPPEVELMALPEGVPESIGVQCNGRRGVMSVRTQHVTYSGQEVSASRFEQLAGRGEAKKWKSSLWAESEEGQPECTMADWLDERGLDRKALAQLAANAAAWEAHQAYANRDQEADAAGEEAANAEDGAGAEAPSEAGEVAMEEDVEVKQEPEEAKPSSDAQPAMHHENGNGSTELQRHPSRENGSSGLGRLHDILASEQEERSSRGRESGSGMELMDMDSGELGPNNLLSRRKGRGRKQAMPRSSLPGHVTSSAAANSGSSAGGTPGHHAAHNGGAVAGSDAETMQEAESSAPPHGEGSAAAQAAAGAPGHKLLRVPQDKVEELEEAGPSSSTSAPEDRVGTCCRVYWPEDREWYEADVRGYEASNGKHLLWYHLDEEEEWLDLAAEARGARLQWLPNADRCKWPPPPQPPPNARQQAAAVAQPAAAAPASAQRTASSDAPSVAEPMEVEQTAAQPAAPVLPGDAVATTPAAATAAAHTAVPAPASSAQTEPPSAQPQGADAVGWRIGVWWVDDACYYYGIIEAVDGERYLVHYDDDEQESLDLKNERVKWVRANGQEESAAARKERAAQASVPSTSPPAPAAATVANPDAPATLKVICNGLRATFDVARMCVLLDKGKEVSPTEFERIAGKASSKKWKTSVRTLKSDGTPGITMETWLLDNGLDVGRPRLGGEAAGAATAPSLDTIRRRQSEAARRTHERKQAQMEEEQGRGPGLHDPLSAAPSKLRGHRESCMCIICKQARRKQGGEDDEAYPSPAGDKAAGFSAPLQVSTPARSTRAKETWKIVTRHATTARTVRGPHVRFGKRAYIRAVPMMPRGNMQHRWWAMPPNRAWTPADWEAARAAPAVAAAGGATPPGPPLPPPRTAPVEGGDEVVVLASAGSSHAALRAERVSKSITFKERLRQCLATERERVTFGKSGIHGWGFFARKDMAQDSMVIQYRGEVVRPVISDLREARYRAQGTDCYLFHVTEHVVIDSTMFGSLARFTNHCCTPCMYTRVVEIDGEVRICFFARTDIRAGQELTFDYRFKEEADNKVICQCGAPNCRGTLN